MKHAPFIEAAISDFHGLVLTGDVIIMVQQPEYIAYLSRVPLSGGTIEFVTIMFEGISTSADVQRTPYDSEKAAMKDFIEATELNLELDI